MIKTNQLIKMEVMEATSDRKVPQKNPVIKNNSSMAGDNHIKPDRPV